MNLTRLRTAFLLTAMASAGAAAQTSGPNQSLLAAAQTEQPAVIQSLHDMVQIES